MKTITICGKEYEIACSAFTYIQYEKIFHTSIFVLFLMLSALLHKPTNKVTATALIKIIAKNWSHSLKMVLKAIFPNNLVVFGFFTIEQSPDLQVNEPLHR